MTKYADRHGVPLTEGQLVRIQHCVGRYGQTQIDEGVISSFDTQYHGVTLKLTKESRQVYREGGFDCVRHLKPGEERYFPLPIGDVTQRPWKCEREHQDFEHGHFAWVEVAGD